MHNRPLRLICRGLGATLMLCAGGALLPVSAGAEESPPAEVRSLVAGASAQGLRIGYSVPGKFAVSQFVDGGGPVAQVSVDTAGTAVGFGSLPYPGENAVAAPGVLTLATGAPVPAYPFYAEASHPVTPSSEVKDPSGAYTVAAHARQHRAEGLAALNFGGVDKPVARIVSTASGGIDPAAAKVTAVSIGEGFRFGDGLLTIASGTSRSVTTYIAGADEPETTSELVIEGAKVGDQAVTIGPDGVHPVGQTVAFPGAADHLNETLSAAGITVRTLSLHKGDGGATTEALQVIVKHPIPGSDVQGTLVYEFGGATSFIAFGADSPGLPPLPAVSQAESPADAAPPTAQAHPVPASGGAAGILSEEPAPSAPAGSPFMRGASSLPASADGLATAAPPPPELDAPGPAGPVEVPSEPVALARPDLTKPSRLLMAVLAAAGAILMGASTLWRRAL